MKEENELFKNRMKDLAGIAYRNSCFTFSDFLGADEVSLFHEISREFNDVGFTLYGGYEDAERVIVRFGKEEELGYVVDFPLVAIHVTPLLKKFSDKLTHRDFLGAILNLGITRDKLGDIIVNENEGYVFADEKIAPFIMDNLTKIKHTCVKSNISDIKEIIYAPDIEDKMEIVASLRYDCLISAVHNMSRSKVVELFRAKKIYVNSRLCENNSAIAKNGDKINVRGMGKFIFDHEERTTKSGKLLVNIKVYK